MQKATACGREAEALRKVLGHRLLQPGVPTGSHEKTQGNVQPVLPGEGGSEGWRAEKDVLAWYRSVPNLAQRVGNLAWQHRKESPIIFIQGGVNAHLAHTEVCVRSEWEVDDVGGYAAQFAQHDFHQDIHYFVIINSGHPGTENRREVNCRVLFNVSAA
jgi:hypothetical protein